MTTFKYYTKENQQIKDWVDVEVSLVKSGDVYYLCVNGTEVAFLTQDGQLARVHGTKGRLDSLGFQTDGDMIKMYN